MWKACQKLLAALENVSTASPNAAIRAARNLGWLSDEDARAAIKLGEERNLAVHMYRETGVRERMTYSKTAPNRASPAT